MLKPIMMMPLQNLSTASLALAILCVGTFISSETPIFQSSRCWAQDNPLQPGSRIVEVEGELVQGNSRAIEIKMQDGTTTTLQLPRSASQVRFEATAELDWVQQKQPVRIITQLTSRGQPTQEITALEIFYPETPLNNWPLKKKQAYIPGIYPYQPPKEIDQDHPANANSKSATSNTVDEAPNDKNSAGDNSAGDSRAVIDAQTYQVVGFVSGLRNRQLSVVAQNSQFLFTLAEDCVIQVQWVGLELAQPGDAIAAKAIAMPGQSDILAAQEVTVTAAKSLTTRGRRDATPSVNANKSAQPKKRKKTP
jgi:hypothetical protein